MRHHALILAAAGLALGTGIAAQARLVPSMPVTAMTVSNAAIEGAGMPRALSEYGFFADLREHEPSAGVVPYRLNTPLYSDGADKLRFIYLPEGQPMRADGDGLLRFPVGTALIKTFAFGAGEDRRLIETRVLLHRADGWAALPYHWNAEQTDATLALAGGRVAVDTAQHGPISYRIPNKNQCKECHGLNDAVVPIGPKARNLSLQWLEAQVARGTLDRVPSGADKLPHWERWREAGAGDAARAYLDVNCAHCHRPQATASNSGLDLRWEQDDPMARGIGKRPVAAGRGSGGHEFSVVPGRPDRSIMVHRMNSVEPGIAMPELGKATVDREGVAAVERWIEDLAM